jgi:hypothetical protein
MKKAQKYLRAILTGFAMFMILFATVETLSQKNPAIPDMVNKYILTLKDSAIGANVETL